MHINISYTCILRTQHLDATQVTVSLLQNAKLAHNATGCWGFKRHSKKSNSPKLPPPTIFVQVSLALRDILLLVQEWKTHTDKDGGFSVPAGSVKHLRTHPLSTICGYLCYICTLASTMLVLLFLLNVLQSSIGRDTTRVLRTCTPVRCKVVVATLASAASFMAFQPTLNL